MKFGLRAGPPGIGTTAAAPAGAGAGTTAALARTAAASGTAIRSFMTRTTGILPSHAGPRHSNGYPAGADARYAAAGYAGLRAPAIYRQAGRRFRSQRG
jgi:hypothetical protein